jgi:hypothetical protein
MENIFAKRMYNAKVNKTGFQTEFMAEFIWALIRLQACID